MDGTSGKWMRPTFEVLPSDTGLPGSELGATPSVRLDGQMILPLTQDHVRANRSVRLGKAKVPLTNDICGPHGSGSSASYALSISLANRLRRRTDSLGS